MINKKIIDIKIINKKIYVILLENNKIIKIITNFNSIHEFNLWCNNNKIYNI
jgi:hypothetical protein